MWTDNVAFWAAIEDGSITDIGDLAEPVDDIVDMGDLADGVSVSTDLGESDWVDNAAFWAAIEDGSLTDIGDLAEPVDDIVDMGDLSGGIGASTDLGELEIAPLESGVGDMKAALRNYLRSYPRSAALTHGRVSWATRPRDGDLPSLVLNQISAPRDYTLTEPSRLVPSRVQADCWAHSNAEATALAAAVNAALSGMRQTIFSEARGALPVQIQGAFLINQQDMSEVDPAAPEEVLHRVSLDFMVWHDE